jgi:hypothetical protein
LNSFVKRAGGWANITFGVVRNGSEPVT